MTATLRPFRVVVFSGAGAADIHRLVSRIHAEVPAAHVCGVLVERRAGKPLPERTRGFLRNMRRADFRYYAAKRALHAARSAAGFAGMQLLRFVHAGAPPAPPSASLEELCSAGCALRITADFHSEDALKFVRDLDADLGIVYATRILKPALFDIPRLGSINIHKRRVPDYRGGGPVGLWELLEGAAEIGITVHQVTEQVDAGAVVNQATIPIDPYDTLTSLAVKAHVVGNDLIVRSVAQYAEGSVRPIRQSMGGRCFRTPRAAQLARYEREIARQRTAFRPTRARSTLKLVLRTAAALPGTVIRNWRWRRRGSFPIVILFHHLVTDRPHRMGISTEYFLRHVAFLRRYYRIVSLSEAVRMLKAGPVKEPTVVLTFDDGYAENYINLRAVVEKTGIPVTLFISTDPADRASEFSHDLNRGISGFRALNWAEVLHMKDQGFEIGSHTRTHFDCGLLDDPAGLEREIVGSKRDLEARLHMPVEFFSFPFGLPNNIAPEAAELATATYGYVCSAYGGYNFSGEVESTRHLKRWPHPNSLWLLELQIQGGLEPEMAAPHLESVMPPHTGNVKHTAA